MVCVSILHQLNIKLSYLKVNKEIAHITLTLPSSSPHTGKLRVNRDALRVFPA